MLRCQGTHTSLYVCRFLLHPAQLDACIHLAPVPTAGQDVSMLRVPVGVGAVVMQSTGKCQYICQRYWIAMSNAFYVGSAGVAETGWAAARALSDTSLPTTDNAISWQACNRSQTAVSLCGLTAKAMQSGSRRGAASIAHTTEDLLYQAEWQATESAPSAAADGPAAAEMWTVSGGGLTLAASIQNDHVGLTRFQVAQQVRQLHHQAPSNVVHTII
jgi:hypothetical protein